MTEIVHMKQIRITVKARLTRNANRALDEMARDGEGRYTGSRGALKLLRTNPVKNIQECRAAHTKNYK